MTKSCTILIPTKDRPTLLRRAVISALLALPEDGEVLVVDDRSTIPVQEVLRDLKDNRLRIVPNQRNGGASGARNHGISLAEGEVVFLLDDDDEILPHYCSYVLTKAFTAPSAPDYGFASYLYVKDDPDGMGYHSERIKSNRLKEGPISTNLPFRHRTCGFGYGFWIRASVLRELGPIDETLTTNEDTEYNCRLIHQAKRGWFSSLPAVRVHDQSTTSTPDLSHLTCRTPASVRAACFATIMERHKEFLCSNPQAEAYLTKRRLRLLAKSGEIAAARQVCKSKGKLVRRLSRLAYLWLHVLYYRRSSLRCQKKPG